MAASLHALPVDPPRVLPAAHDLRASAIQATASDQWIGGIEFQPDGIGGTAPTVHMVAEGDHDQAMSKSAALTAPALVRIAPLLIEQAWIRPISREWDDTALHSLAERSFNAQLSALIETQWVTETDTAALSEGVTRIGTTSVLSSVAIAELEDAMAAVGGHGTLYMTPGHATMASQGLYEEGGKLYTRSRGNLVIVGNFGAKGETTGTGTVTVTENYIYATLGEPELYLHEDFLITSGLDHEHNVRTVRAETWAAVKFVSPAWTAFAKYA